MRKEWKRREGVKDQNDVRRGKVAVAYLSLFACLQHYLYFRMFSAHDKDGEWINRSCNKVASFRFIGLIFYSSSPSLWSFQGFFFSALDFCVWL